MEFSLEDICYNDVLIEAFVYCVNTGIEKSLLCVQKRFRSLLTLAKNKHQKETYVLYGCYLKNNKNEKSRFDLYCSEKQIDQEIISGFKGFVGGLKYEKLYVKTSFAKDIPARSCTQLCGHLVIMSQSTIIRKGKLLSLGKSIEDLAKLSMEITKCVHESNGRKFFNLRELSKIDTPENRSLFNKEFKEIFHETDIIVNKTFTIQIFPGSVNIYDNYEVFESSTVVSAKEFLKILNKNMSDLSK